MKKAGISDSDARRVIEEGTETVTHEDLQKVIDREADISRKFHGPLRRFMNDSKTLFSLLKDYWHKNYTEVPWWTIGSAVAALLYVLNPMDIIPDFIPGIGLLDDASVVSACLFMLQRDLAKYTIWKSHNSEQTTED